MFFSLYLLFCLLAARICVSSAWRLGLLDTPDHRKSHRGAVPLAGGVSVVICITLGSLMLELSADYNLIVAIIFMLFLVGLLDDLHEIGPRVRLLAQFSAGFMVVISTGIAIYHVGDLLGIGNIPLLMLTMPLTALAFAGMSNAFNMIDGIDGLAASMAALPLSVVLVLAMQSDHETIEFLQIVLIPIAVFLLFNLGPNNRLLPKMFLGDSGSLTLGFITTLVLVYASQVNELIKPVTALWLVTVPLMDMLATMLVRFRAGRGMMDAGRDHLHHRLLDLGISPRLVLALLVLHATLAALSGLLLETWFPEYISMLLYFLTFITHCLIVLKFDSITKRLAPVKQLQHT